MSRHGEPQPPDLLPNRRQARLADGEGVILGIENVPSNFLSTLREYAQFLADVDRQAVRAYLDPANGAALGNGYPENWVTAARGRIAMAHAKDYDRRLRVHLPCGQGELGWDSIVATLTGVGHDDYLMIETPPISWTTAGSAEAAGRGSRTSASPSAPTTASTATEATEPTSW